MIGMKLLEICRLKGGSVEVEPLKAQISLWHQTGTGTQPVVPKTTI
jgi:hypothetical protein